MWEITPTILPLAFSLSRALSAVSNVSWSRVPKPSSINKELISTFLEAKSDKANANAKENNIETFGSALKGTSHRDGNCNTWYVMEMAEKRAMSRAVLKLTGFYELGVFGEDESDNFKKK